MTQYFVRRLGLSLLVVWIFSSFVFVALRVLSGDYATVQVSNQFFAGSGHASKAEALHEVRKRLGTDDPVLVQYAKFIGGIFRGDFGRSFLDNKPAITVTREAMPYTLQLGIMSLLI